MVHVWKINYDKSPAMEKNNLSLFFDQLAFFPTVFLFPLPAKAFINNCTYADRIQKGSATALNYSHFAYMRGGGRLKIACSLHLVSRHLHNSIYRRITPTTTSDLEFSSRLSLRRTWGFAVGWAGFGSLVPACMRQPMFICKCVNTSFTFRTIFNKKKTSWSNVYSGNKAAKYPMILYSCVAACLTCFKSCFLPFCIFTLRRSAHSAC